ICASELLATSIVVFIKWLSLVLPEFRSRHFRKFRATEADPLCRKLVTTACHNPRSLNLRRSPGGRPKGFTTDSFETVPSCKEIQPYQTYTCLGNATGNPQDVFGIH